MEKCRCIVLTDINRGPEIDDIQSMLRLLLYANCIDIEGLIACTSCFVKHPGPKRNLKLLRSLIDAYEEALPRLRIHAEGWPTAKQLHDRSAFGIPVFGRAPGDGFADERWTENDGVQRLLSAMRKDDERPLWIALWGGANTLAQAVWQAEKSELPETFDAILKKLRIYSISDQDHAGHWLRERYGDRLFYIVSPSSGDFKGSSEYYLATWPGISADRSEHGSEDGIHHTKGFSGADYSCIDREWIHSHIRCTGRYGSRYPRTVFITEGDTPSFLGLIPNGLNEPERPDWGGWGGRYTRQQLSNEPFPIWTTVSDTVVGTDGKEHTSPQATIWRWRSAFQNDFAARIQWTASDFRKNAPHPLVLSAPCTRLSGKPGEECLFSVNVEDPDGSGYNLSWLTYPEAGTFLGSAEAMRSEPALFSEEGERIRFRYRIPDGSGELHMLLQATTHSAIPLTRYLRFVIRVRSDEDPNGGDT